MGANTEDMINQLQMQQMLPQQPSFMGIQAPPDPQAIRALLQHLQAQQAIAQTGNTPGQYGYLHDAGQKAFASIGQGLGGAIGGAMNAPPPNSGPSQQSSQLMQARAKYAQDIAAGVPENTARQTAAQALVQAGFPQAPELLEKAVAAGNAATHQQSETDKNTGEVANYKSEINDRLLKQARETAQFIPRPDKANSEYDAQQDPNTGKIEYSKRGDKMPPPPLTPAADSARDILAKKVANYDLQLGTAVGRGGGDLRQDLLTRAIAINPDYDEKNYKQSSDALKAYGPAGTLGQQTIKLQNAINHLGLLDQYGKALDSGDVKTANIISNKLSSEFGGAPIAGYNAIAPIVASEVSGALVKGGGGVEERAEKARELGAQLSTPARSAATQGMRNLLSAQYKNYQNNYEKTTRRKDFGDMFPVEGGFNASTETPAATGGGSWQDMGNGVKVRVKQ